MPMLKDPSQKYQPFQFKPPASFKRTWPDRHDRLEKTPRWLSTDLRDGNQALVNPMSVEQKTKFFKLLIECGFKEIEVGYPTASETDWKFVRLLAEGEIPFPEDVCIQVMAAAREDLIRESVKCLKGPAIKKAAICIYNGSGKVWRDIVFNHGVEEVIEMGVAACSYYRKLCDEAAEEGWDTEFNLVYAPEGFTQTEPEVAVRLCSAVADAWYAGRDRYAGPKLIYGLPTTLEAGRPMDFADQIEYFCQNMPHRDSFAVSIHCHNDRGTGVASTELAWMAGGDRIEGCLFGNGERSGNLDLVTYALDLYTQGVYPGLDFSDMKKVLKIVTECTQLPIHPRHPYVGELIHCAFSGAHQDAIKKGFALREKNNDPLWTMPYLGIDPQDIGASYEAIIRVNSQSGKGGFAYTIARTTGLDMPRKMQVEFYNVVQPITDAKGREILSNELETIFRKNYCFGGGYEGRFVLADPKTSTVDGHPHFDATVSDLVDNTTHPISGNGSSFSQAVVNGLNYYFPQPVDKMTLREQHHHAMPDGSTAAFVELGKGKTGQTRWGVGVDDDLNLAYAQAIISSANSLHKNYTTTNLLSVIRDGRIQIGGPTGHNGLVQEIIKEMVQGIKDGKFKLEDLAAAS